MSIQLKNIKEKIISLCLKYHRPPTEVTLLAVTKQQSIEKIREAITAGQKCFGENYLQEALPKISALQNENLEWHYIGAIQSNKTKQIAENFSWVQSVSSLRIAELLNQYRPTNLPPLQICLQINISNEDTKSGLINPTEIYELANQIQTLKHLKLRGLMCIPAIKNTLPEQRAEYKKLREIYENLIAQSLLIDILSMGMSDDLEAAIAEGATMVRVGTAIFGKRR